MILSFGHLHRVTDFGFFLDRASDKVKMGCIFVVESWTNLAFDRGCGVVGIDEEFLFFSVAGGYHKTIFGIGDSLLVCFGFR